MVEITFFERISNFVSRSLFGKYDIFELVYRYDKLVVRVYIWNVLVFFGRAIVAVASARPAFVNG